ncbi:MAG: dNTP triphosphohydrolase [Dehalococcoidia bacterium]
MSPYQPLERFHSTAKGHRDQRSETARDRDRILYSSAFKRLGGVTQVAAAGEHHVFHNRLTHTLKVGQIARRTAEYLAKTAPELADAVGSVDPEAAEAAAFAHDLGHPPFGHIAEERLQQLLICRNVVDGFEGNPQSFRIVTKLAMRHEDSPGLNLTRSTLNGILKYPWLRSSNKTDYGYRKWGAYSTEQEQFEWARAEVPTGNKRTAEAEIMDWADDIAYSVHDVEDFFRARLIPLDRLMGDSDEQNRFLESIPESRRRRGMPEEQVSVKEEEREAFVRFLTYLKLSHAELRRPFADTLMQRAQIRAMTSWLIGRYIQEGIALQDPQSSEDGRCVVIEPNYRYEIGVLKELTWVYVIDSPSLATQQRGQRAVIEGLFKAYYSELKAGRESILPARFREYLTEAEKNGADPDQERPRVVADLIAGMTEAQALEIHGRLIGTRPGMLIDSVLM